MHIYRKVIHYLLLNRHQTISWKKIEENINGAQNRKEKGEKRRKTKSKEE